MTKKEIFIVSAPIRSGKTTSLMKFISHHKNVYGILTPLINGQRVFMDIQAKDVFRMEADAEEDNILFIGKYSFSAEAFHRATEILRSALKAQTGWLIVDEIGPLELRGQGFHDVVREMLLEHSEMKLIFVVRDSSLNKVVEFFTLEEYGQVVVNPMFINLDEVC